MNQRKTRVDETSEAIGAAVLGGTGLSSEKAEEKIQIAALTQMAYSMALAADALVEIKNTIRNPGFLHQLIKK